MNKATNGEVKYSEVLKVLNSKSYARINVYPNPVTNNTINLLIEDQPAGEYEIRMINNFGQPVFISKIKHTGGDIIQTLRPNQTMLKGVYQLEVNMPGIQKITGKIIY